MAHGIYCKSTNPNEVSTKPFKICRVKRIISRKDLSDSSLTITLIENNFIDLFNPVFIAIDYVIVNKGML
jgi:hypothetical protein